MISCRLARCHHQAGRHEGNCTTLSEEADSCTPLALACCLRGHDQKLPEGGLGLPDKVPVPCECQIESLSHVNPGQKRPLSRIHEERVSKSLHVGRLNHHHDIINDSSSSRQITWGRIHGVSRLVREGGYDGFVEFEVPPQFLGGEIHKGLFISPHSCYMEASMHM